MILLIILLCILVLNNRLKAKIHINWNVDHFYILKSIMKHIYELTWRKLICAFWIIMAWILLFTYLKCDNVPIILYVSIWTPSVMFPVTTMFYWVEFKEAILLVKTNKELTHTTRTILLFFPEGVVIRSQDSVSKNTITRFANDGAKNVLNWEIDN